MFVYLCLYVGVRLPPINHLNCLKFTPTRTYRSESGKSVFGLTNNHRDPNTGFRFHAVIKEKQYIKIGSFARIQHAVTGSIAQVLSPNT